MLSDLDGFLTGVAIGPELILPSEWLPAVWGGEQPEFADRAEAQAILGTIMGRYNEILRDVAAGTINPIFWENRDGDLVAMDWAEGFLDAIRLRIEAWKKLMTSPRDCELLLPILALCCDERGESLLGLSADEEDRLAAEAADVIPDCIVAIDRYWHRTGGRQISMPLRPGRPPPAASKVGRNEPCRCGSGKKFKACCGRRA